jgi:hypothetical protein
LRVVKKCVGDVEAETIHAARQPGVQNRQRRFARVRLHPVQLGLLAKELVMIILPPRRLVAPGRTAEHRKPVVRNCAVTLWIGPDIPILPRRIAVAAGGEPGVFVAGMRQDFVEDDLQAPRMGGIHQRREVLQRAVIGMHVVIVGDVVAPVAIGRRMDRRQPDRIHAQRRDIIEL